MLSLNAELASQMPEQSHFNLLCTAHWNSHWNSSSSIGKSYRQKSALCFGLPNTDSSSLSCKPWQKVTSRQALALFSYFTSGFFIVLFLPLPRTIPNTGNSELLSTTSLFPERSGAFLLARSMALKTLLCSCLQAVPIV